MGAIPAEAGWSTATVEPADAFDYWRDSICDAFVQLAARPRHDGVFRGAIIHHAAGELDLSTVTADAQRVDRTRALIARSHEDYLLASIQLDGVGEVRQDDRVARLRPGSMAFYDSTRPYTLDFDDRFRQLVVQVPKSVVARSLAPGATAVALDGTGPCRLVADFLRGMADEHEHGRPTGGLEPHAVGLLEFALGIAGSSATPDTHAATLRTVLDTVARAAADPDVGADDIAAACHVSRRTVHRVLAADGRTLREVLRHERVGLAKKLLRSAPHLPVAVVASRCGFRGETQLHRAFRDVVGTSPGVYRAGRG